MNTIAEALPADTLRLRDIALAAIASACLRPNEKPSTTEDTILQKAAARVAGSGHSLAETLTATLAAPVETDRPLVELGHTWDLAPLETLAIALAHAVEQEPLVGRVLAHVQAPVGGSRPTLGLIGHVFDAAFEPPEPTLVRIVHGHAMRAGLVVILNDSAPLPERTVMVPSVLSLALANHDGSWPGTTIDGPTNARVPLPASVLADAKKHAVALQGATPRTLVLRTGSPAEGRAVAAAIARDLQRRPLFIETDKLAGVGAWLQLRRLIPVHCFELCPGERRVLAAIPGYQGPVLVVCGPDGAIETAHGAAASWTLGVPSEAERRTLWMDVLQDQELAAELARDFRHGAGRIAFLGRLAQHQAAIARRTAIERDDVLAAAWTGEGSGLDALAEPLRTRVPDAALILTAELRADLDSLLLRCRVRENLAAGLGDSAKTRYRPGVRALFTGPSGTGKTLAAGWIATQLGLPLYRVDLASITSKYIGETEKNLSQLLARAEQAEVVLLFDEADSLFGKRTDINDSNDRFANAQTNYLLQRIESYDGVVLLTSNSQARFDTAFARRLDFAVEFPAPGPEERRKLWLSHLGTHAEIEPAQLNQLAALVDLSGAQIRNAVLAAAVLCQEERRRINHADLMVGLESELRKHGKQLAVALRPQL